MKHSKGHYILYALTAITLTVSLAMLVWLHQLYAHNRIAWLGDMRALFTRDEALRPPHDLGFKFRYIEQLAKIVTSGPFAQDIYVSKVLADGREHVVHPFYFDSSPPNWRESLASWTRLTLRHNDNVYGYLYIKEDLTAQRSVQAAIGVLGGLLLLTLGMLTWGLVSKQSELKGAYVALAEKDRQMIRLERLSLAGQLSANIFHDIKKPMANIKHTLPELIEFFKDQSIAPEGLENIRTQTDLFFSILKDLGLERFVRTQDTQNVFVDLNSILRQSWALVQYERKTIETIWRLDESDSILVLAPPYRLIQVLSNLILNAYQAMDGKGIMVLTSARQGDRAMIEVIDDGPGLPEGMKERLFEPFASTKGEEEGSGLGLYISRSILEGLGGSLELVPSQIGAHFRVTLPVAPGE